MVNISSRGEKYIFARKVLEKANSEPWISTLLFKYDIWCNFLPYLVNKGFMCIPTVACIPIGHSLTHIMGCQYSYFPWLVRGNGLSPGEEIETTWSKLGHIMPRIREMAPGTREDALSDEFEQINRSMLRELPGMLLKQLDKVDAARVMCADELSHLRKRFPTYPLSDEQLDHLDLTQLERKTEVWWEVIYVRYLLEHQTLQRDAEAFEPEAPEFVAAHRRIRAVEKSLKAVEDVHHIRPRYNAQRMSRWIEAARVEWLRNIKETLRSNLVLEQHYSERARTYCKKPMGRPASLTAFLVGYKGSTLNRQQLKRTRERQNEIIAQLNDLIRVTQPLTLARITKANCRLDNWEFWSDQKSKDHIQFTAYKSRQKLKRAQEEENYTQREIQSVLIWCREEAESALAQYRASLSIDQTNVWTSELFYAKKVQETTERRRHWEAILVPHLKVDVRDLHAID